MRVELALVGSVTIAIPRGAVRELAHGLDDNVLIAPGVRTDGGLLFKPPGPVSVGVSCHANGVDVECLR